MKKSNRDGWKWVGSAAIVLVLSAMFASRAGAQGSGGNDSIAIQPYKGPPIYLEEPEQVAAPTIVRREMIPEEYEDGTVRIEREVAHFSDNHLEADGAYREYHPNGKLFVEGRFRRGRQHGQWTYYFDNGQLNRKATYNNGQPDGQWDVFRADGTLAAKRSFRNGQRHGDWTTYDETGKKPLREEHYEAGKWDGVWKIYFPDGKLRQQLSFKDGQRHGTSAEWNDQGEKTAEITHVNNKLDGIATQWLADGTKLVHQYKDGRLVSQSKE